MAENNDFTHLPLPLLFRGKPKLHGGGRVSDQTRVNTANRITHGGYIKHALLNCPAFGKSVEQNALKTARLI